MKTAQVIEELITMAINEEAAVQLVSDQKETLSAVWG